MLPFFAVGTANPSSGFFLTHKYIMYFRQKRAYPDHQEEVPGKQARQAADAKKAASAWSADTAGVAGQPSSSKGDVTNLLESLVRWLRVCVVCPCTLSVGKAGTRPATDFFVSVVQYCWTIQLAPCVQYNLPPVYSATCPL